jgi:hypothetical protein
VAFGDLFHLTDAVDAAELADVGLGPSGLALLAAIKPEAAAELTVRAQVRRCSDEHPDVSPRDMRAATIQLADVRVPIHLDARLMISEPALPLRVLRVTCLVEGQLLVAPVFDPVEVSSGNDVDLELHLVSVGWTDLAAGPGAVVAFVVESSRGAPRLLHGILA